MGLGTIREVFVRGKGGGRRRERVRRASEGVESGITSTEKVSFEFGILDLRLGFHPWTIELLDIRGIHGERQATVRKLTFTSGKSEVSSSCIVDLLLKLYRK